MISRSSLGVLWEGITGGNEKNMERQCHSIDPKGAAYLSDLRERRCICEADVALIRRRMIR